MGPTGVPAAAVAAGGDRGGRVGFGGGGGGVRDGHSREAEGRGEDLAVVGTFGDLGDGDGVAAVLGNGGRDVVVDPLVAERKAGRGTEVNHCKPMFWNAQKGIDKEGRRN